MANLSWPSGISPASVDPTLFSPQIVLRSLSGVNQVISLGPDRWQGVTIIPTYGTGSAAKKKTVRAFLASLQGQLNTFDMPLYGREGDLPEGTDLVLAAPVAITSGFARIRVSGASSGLVRGDMISIGSRAYVLETDMAGGSMDCLPARITGAAGNPVLWNPPFMRVRLTESGAQNSRETPSFSGPWYLEWESVHP